MTAAPDARLCQIAMSVLDLRGTHRWYENVLGLKPAGGTNSFRGPALSMVQGLPRAASTCWWLVDRQPAFQLELFAFNRPTPRRSMAGREAWDIGYSTVTFEVDDFDGAVDRARAAGTRFVSDPMGPAGARRVCVKDPEGVLVELAEPLGALPPVAHPDAAARVCSVRLSVPELDRSLALFEGVLGLRRVADDAIHRPEHEQLWRAAEADVDVAALQAGNVVVELAQYRHPAPNPWPAEYRISDQGLLNIAFTFDGVREFRTAVSRVRAAGLRCNGSPIAIPGVLGLTYFDDDQGFSVELLYLPPWLGRRFGFAPKPAPRFAPFLRAPAGA